MQSAFQWVNSIIQTIGLAIPRLVLIRETYRGVLFRRNGKSTLLEPGLTWYWPVTSELRKLAITSRWWETGPVTVPNGNRDVFGFPVVRHISVGVNISIIDPLKAVYAFNMRSIAVGFIKSSIRNRGTNEMDMIVYVNERLHKYGMTASNLNIVDDFECLMMSRPHNGHESIDWSATDADEISGMK